MQTIIRVGGIMDNKEFVNIAMHQDKRNIFGEYFGNVEMIPNELKEFFKKYNPVDVEVTMDGNVIHFFPVEKLESLQEEYDLGPGNFVFSTCNGDPIFYNIQGIFSRYHWETKAKSEKLAENFGKFLNLIDR